MLPQAQKYKMSEALVGITPKVSRFPNKKWFRLIVIWRSAVPEISGEEGMFSRLQHVMKATEDGRVHITPEVHYELTLWRQFINFMEQCPANLR